LFTLHTLLNAIICCSQLNTCEVLGLIRHSWIISHRCSCFATRCSLRQAVPSPPALAGHPPLNWLVPFSFQTFCFLAIFGVVRLDGLEVGSGFATFADLQFCLELWLHVHSYIRWLVVSSRFLLGTKFVSVPAQISQSITSTGEIACCSVHGLIVLRLLLSGCFVSFPAF
jgi:hypothetical protein